jgi:hypothetical protein
MNRLVLLFAGLVTFYSQNLLAQCTSGTALATSYASNNGSRGAMFDITANTLLTITCFDANLYAGTTSTYQIYYKSGTYVGAESNSAAWTLAGTATNVTSLGYNVPTPLPISVNLVIPAGQTYSFYITNTTGGGLNYTASAITGVTLATDPNLKITGGVGKSYPFATTYNYRLFNGTVHYTTGTVLPVSLEYFSATPQEKKVKMAWKTGSENNSDYYVVERLNGSNEWDRVGTLAAAPATSNATNYEMEDAQPLFGTSYYRLVLVDKNGVHTTLETKAVERSLNLTEDQLLAYPNPTKGNVTIAGTEDELEGLSVYNSMGQDITAQLDYTVNEGQRSFDFSNQATSFYIVKTTSSSTILIKE